MLASYLRYIYVGSDSHENKSVKYALRNILLADIMYKIQLLIKITLHNGCIKDMTKLPHILGIHQMCII